jgi:diacylglycerol kinase
MNQHLNSLKLAFRGIWYAFRTQLNFKIHSFIAVTVIIIGWLLKISYLEWIVLTLTIALVFVAEMINTAIESMTDLITTEHRQSAKIAKDVAAGMVLLGAISSVIVGIIIFLPKIISG